MASPQYKNTDASAFKPLMELCQRYHVPFINHYTDTTFNNKREYFIDSAHLNSEGAAKYTLAVIKDLKRTYFCVGTEGSSFDQCIYLHARYTKHNKIKETK